MSTNVTVVSDQRWAIFFFFIVTLVYTCRAFFCCILKKYLSHILFWSQFVSVCFAMKLFFSFKIHCPQMFQLFQTRDGPVFSSSHLSTLVTLFSYHQKIIVPYILLCTVRLSLFRNEILFLLSNTLSTNVTVVSDQGWAFFFFHCHTCLHLSRFFCCIIKKYLSHILFWSQFVSICFAMKFFYSFKIHCLQMLQLFQTRDGSIFFIVTLVYTCRAFLCCIIKKY